MPSTRPRDYNKGGGRVQRKMRDAIRNASGDVSSYGPCHKYGRSYDTHHAVADGWDSGVVVSVGWASDGERHEVLALLGESQTTVAVTARIGDGSMGEVHRARDTKLDRGVAAGEPRPGPALDTPSASAIIGTVSGAASQTGGSRGAGAPPRPCPRRS